MALRLKELLFFATILNYKCQKKVSTARLSDFQCGNVTPQQIRPFQKSLTCRWRTTSSCPTFRRTGVASFGRSSEDILPMRRTNQQSGSKVIFKLRKLKTVSKYSKHSLGKFLKLTCARHLVNFKTSLNYGQFFET